MAPSKDPPDPGPPTGAGVPAGAADERVHHHRLGVRGNELRGACDHVDIRRHDQWLIQQEREPVGEDDPTAAPVDTENVPASASAWLITAAEAPHGIVHVPLCAVAGSASWPTGLSPPDVVRPWISCLLVSRKYHCPALRVPACGWPGLGTLPLGASSWVQVLLARS